ncbi:RNase H superfamily protein [Burkholderia pseudomallei]|nr:RNase H superfamily protein [Burkholderia pseudomallei]
MRKKPRILSLDIETSPILGYVWSLWKQNVSLNQIHSEWCILSFLTCPLQTGPAGV